jgi:hypothetical protein
MCEEGKGKEGRRERGRKEVKEGRRLKINLQASGPYIGS